MWRIVKWLFVLVVVLFLAIFIGLPLAASTDPGRKKLEEALTAALDRDVAMEKLDVGIFFSSIDLVRLSIANPAGYPKADLFKAGALRLEANLQKVFEKQVQGSLKGSNLEVLVQRKGGGSNLDGLGGGKGGDGGEGPDLDLALELTDSKVTIEDLDKGEKLVLDGVGIWMKLTNRGAERNTGIKIRIDSIDRAGIRIRDLELDAKESQGWLDLEKIEARFAGPGQLKGSGRLQLKDGDAWQVKLDAVGVKLTEDLMPVVGSLFPLAAKAEGQVDGQIDAAFDVRGNGLTWAAMKQALLGKGEVTLTGLNLPAGSVLAQAAALAGRSPGKVQINDAGAKFDLSKGWLDFRLLYAKTTEVSYDLDGRVSLDGELDLTMDLMPLVKIFGGGKAYKDVAKRVDKIPVGIEGTSASPRFKLPTAEELLRGLVEKAAKDEIGDALDKLKKKAAGGK